MARTWGTICTIDANVNHHQGHEGALFLAAGFAEERCSNSAARVILETPFQACGRASEYGVLRFAQDDKAPLIFLLCPRPFISRFHFRASLSSFILSRRLVRVFGLRASVLPDGLGCRLVLRSVRTRLSSARRGPSGESES